MFEILKEVCKAPESTTKVTKLNKQQKTEFIIKLVIN